MAFLPEDAAADVGKAGLDRIAVVGGEVFTAHRPHRAGKPSAGGGHRPRFRRSRVDDPVVLRSGRTVCRLCGFDPDRPANLRKVTETAHLGLGLDEVLRMAPRYPVDLIDDARRGRIGPGAFAEFVHLSDDLSVWDVVVT